MRKAIYAAWAAWAVICTVLGCLKIIDATTAFSWFWFPIGVLASAVFLMFLISDLGAVLKKKEEKKQVPTCENCLFRKTADLLNRNKKEGEEKEICIGLKMGATAELGRCPYHQFE